MKMPMRREYVSIVVALLAFPVSGMAQVLSEQNSPIIAQPTASTAINPARIAFVNIQQVIAGCDEGKQENAKFQQWAEKKRAELQELQKEIDSLKYQLDVQGAKLTEEARNDLVDRIDAKETLFQRSQQDSQKEADRRQQRSTDALYQKIVPVIAKLAKEKNWDCVFFVDQNRVAYINPLLLITDEVIKAYNATYLGHAGQTNEKQ